MKLHELEYQLRLARERGAEDNADVSYHIRTGETYSGEADGEEIVADGPLEAVEFRRAGRHEIVLR